MASISLRLDGSKMFYTILERSERARSNRWRSREMENGVSLTFSHPHFLSLNKTLSFVNPSPPPSQLASSPCCSPASVSLYPLFPIHLASLHPNHHYGELVTYFAMRPMHVAPSETSPSLQNQLPVLPGFEEKTHGPMRVYKYTPLQ